MEFCHLGFVAWLLFGDGTCFFGEMAEKNPQILSRIYMVLVVIVGWVLFRAESLTYAIKYLKTLFLPGDFAGQLFRVPSEFLQNDIIIAFVFGIIASLGGIAFLRKLSQEKHGFWQHMYIVLTFVLLLSQSPAYTTAVITPLYTLGSNRCIKDTI